MAQDPGTGCKVAGRIRRLAAAEAGKAVGKECLQWGLARTVGVSTSGVVTSVVSAALLAATLGAEVGRKASSSDTAAIPTLIPPTCVCVTICALPIQKVELKLKSVGIS
ncbi:armadillo-type protein [Babesia caballi]|uniref:Armadillo-type protein n=1 Tax=Babesia caballi TaxID=5871 RepID=A0AAV4LQP5_BABCB|nr:armadillo-type protein [Babesia caballi]